MTCTSNVSYSLSLRHCVTYVYRSYTQMSVYGKFSIAVVNHYVSTISAPPRSSINFNYCTSSSCIQVSLPVLPQGGEN